MKEDVGYIKARLEDVHLDVKEIKRHRIHIEERVRLLEKMAAYAKGVIAFLLALVTAAVTFVSRMV